jgi:hypothetical protein
MLRNRQAEMSAPGSITSSVFIRWADHGTGALDPPYLTSARKIRKSVKLGSLTDFRAGGRDDSSS